MQVTAYITDWCSDSSRSLRLLESTGLSFEVIDIEEVSGAEDAMKLLNGGSGKVPTILIDNDGSRRVLVEPSDSDLKRALGL